MTDDSMDIIFDNRLIINKMKRLVVFFALMVICFGCAKEYGDPVTVNYAINGSYDGLDVSNAFQVTVSDQVTEAVVTVGEQAHDRVIVKVTDGTLHIGFKPNTRYNGTAKAVIPVNAGLKEIDLSGASSFVGDLNGESVDIELSGASTYRGEVKATELEIDMSGASDATLSGYCRNKMDIDLSGASNLKAFGFDAQSVYGEMSGGSSADVTVCSDLNVSLGGGSTLTYGTLSGDCNPKVSCSSSGGSTVRSR